MIKYNISILWLRTDRKNYSGDCTAPQSNKKKVIGNLKLKGCVRAVQCYSTCTCTCKWLNR